ncbi:MAG: hypothetical protein KKH98_05755 [Spirochaetes bacterium]|nr:hypothetical protein [Spirochaetota bacterium]
MKRYVIYFIILFLVDAAIAELPKPKFKLTTPGKETVIDYSKYGTFKNVETKDYIYVIKDRKGLIKAAGEGIFPDNRSVYKNKIYNKIKQGKNFKGTRWDHVNTSDPVTDYFVWATTSEEPGVQQLFTAYALKEAGHIRHAVKAFYSILVHYPRSACFSADQSFVWYVAIVAMDKLYALCRQYPDLGLKLEGAWIDIKNGKDTDLNNDIISVNPGKLVKVKRSELTRPNLKKMKIISKRGRRKVKLVKYKNGHWQMLVDNKPYIVKGISYSPTKVGESPHDQTMRNWMFIDDNKNGLIDGAEDAWVDKNRNNKKDKNEKIIGDFQLLKEMGCNTIRYYHVPPNNQYSKKEFNKELLLKLYKKYKIRVIMGDFLGAYTIGSGADWAIGTDYKDKDQRQRMKEVVKQMVLDHKDEPYLLMWMLGNENNMSGDYTGVNATRTLASKHPVEYAKFLNEVAEMIHELDKNHPVAVGNRGLDLVEYYDNYAPAIDILGINEYPDKDGFGSLWYRARKLMDRPILITEYGADAYDSNRNIVDEKAQMQWHQGLWQDIQYNIAGGIGDGNALGGMPFEWLDEWWKSLKGRKDTQQQTQDFPMPFPDNWSSEEFLGIAGQGDGNNSPYMRHLRETYYLYKKIWN